MNTKALMLTGALALAGSAHAGGLSMCEADSDFDLRIAKAGLEFHRGSGTPAQVEMRGGRLLVDGREQALSAADARRVAQFEREVRALVPEVKLIALDAVDIAYGAVVHVAAALGGEDSADTARLVARLDGIRAEAASRIEAGTDSAAFDEQAFEQNIETLVGELVPAIAGEAAGMAIRMALSGDEHAARELEQRMQRMERELEAEVEARARELEARAQSLCPRIAGLDALESALEYRLADNRALDLIRYE